MAVDFISGGQESGTLGPGTCIFTHNRLWSAESDGDRVRILADTQGVIVDVTAPEDLGYTREQLLGQDIITLIPLQHRVAHYRGFSRWARDGEPTIMDRPLQLPALAADGSARPTAMVLRAILRSGDRLVECALEVS